MTRIEMATPIGVGVTLGLSAGVLLGMVAGIAGVVLGLAVGAVAGYLAGRTMHRDEGHRAVRVRELDAIIGVGGGDIGAAPVSLPPEPTPGDWMAEWLTPPPPAVG